MSFSRASRSKYDPIANSPRSFHTFGTQFRALMLLLALFASAVQPQLGIAGSLLRPRMKRSTLSGRIVAKVPVERLSTVGPNYVSYVFELAAHDKKAQPKVIKVSYRFDLGQPQLPTSFFDYSLVHKFSMTRDDDCDESLQNMSAKYVFDHDGNFQGKQEALEYAKNAPALQLDEPSTLSCYVVTPGDYRSTSKNRSSHS